MKKLLVLILFLCSVRAEAAITKIVQVACAASSGSCTTSAVNATGGNFVVIALSDENSGSTALTDSSSNTYSQCGPTEFEPTFLTRIRIFYKANAAVSASMTFTATGSSSLPAIAVGVFSGVNTVAPCDQTVGVVNSASTSATFGSITPSANGALVISGMGQPLATSAMSASAPFTFSDTANVDVETASGSVNYGVAIGFSIQTTAAAANPTWSWTTSSQSVGVNASFFATGTGPLGANSSMMLVGVGQ